MKKLLLFSLSALMLSGAFTHAEAATTDSQGYPVLYLRGSFNELEWAVNDNYKFTRSGNVYSLTINNSNKIGEGEFKIADDSWDMYNLGADKTVNESMYVNGAVNGSNMKTSGLSNAVISFTYPGNQNTSDGAKIKFVINGVEPQEETTSSEYPDVYLRGGFDDKWSCLDAYKFSRSGNVYSLTIGQNNPVGECEFKIASEDWTTCDLGADVTVNSSQYVKATAGGKNMKTSGWNEAIITFTYAGQGKEATIAFIIDGLEIQPEPEPEPEPGDYPTVYLRGSFSGDSWPVNDLWKFTCNNGTYSLTINSSNAVPAGSEFKIASEDWTTVNLGGSDENIYIDQTQTITLSSTNNNLHTANGISSGTISFTYSEGATSTPVKFEIDGTQPAPVPGLSGTLPVLYINVYTDKEHTALNNEIIDKDLAHKDYFKYATYWLDINGCAWLEELGAESVGSEEAPLDLQIKARGNYTRTGFSKKPFKLKLDKKANLLALTPEKSKHYAILAHADDNFGYMRNFTGFNLGQRIGLPWTPKQQPVEVVINGDYRGLYFLTESIRVGDGRVPIEELEDEETDRSLISGGYIVELDNYDEADDAQIRMEEKTAFNWWEHSVDRLRITFDTPEVYSEQQRKFITEQFTAMNNYIGDNDDRIWAYMDLDDAARYYIVEEIVSHTESYHGSTYLFRDRGEGHKWHFSPLWDFGNAFNGQTGNFFYNCDPYGNTWIPSLRMNNKFNAKVNETWLWFMSNKYDGLIDDITEYANHIAAAAAADHKRWGSASLPNSTGSNNPSPVQDNSDMQSKLNSVTSHLNSKTNWLKSQFGDYTRGNYAEPERDTTLAAELPDYATGVENVIVTDSNAPAEYYNLQGLRVVNPQPGTVYIVRQGGKVTKEIAR